MAKPKVTAILLNYNGFKDTVACLESLLASSYKSLNIVIVDNLSPDGSCDKLDNYLSEMKYDYQYFGNVESAMNDASVSVHSITLIQAGSNKGYGHGNNIGIRLALRNKANYVLVLNNDTIVKPDFLEPLVDACEKDPATGIASGKIYYYDHPDTLWYAGGKLHSLTAKVEHFHIGEKDTGQAIPEPITFITGCLWLVPSRVFEKVGLINEDYFMYVEDLEFCTRVIETGLKLKVCPDSHIYHKVGGERGQWSLFSIYWMSKNKMQFIFDHSSNTLMILRLFYHVIYMSMWFISKRRFDVLHSHLKGIFSVRK